MALGGALLGAQEAAQAADNATLTSIGETEIDFNGINARVYLNWVNAGVDVWNVPPGVTGKAEAEIQCGSNPNNTVDGEVDVASFFDDITLQCGFLTPITKSYGKLL